MKANIYPEIKEIAEHLEAIGKLAKAISEQIDCEGLDWYSADIISNCTEQDDKLYQNGIRLDNGGGLIDGDYYCHQTVGYLGDDFYGNVYFVTEAPGEFVKVSYSM